MTTGRDNGKGDGSPVAYSFPSFDPQRALERAQQSGRQSVLDMQRRFDTAVSTMQSDAQRAADEFLEKNPSVKQLVTKAEEMKNSALGQVKAWSSSNSLASLASLRNAVQVSQGGMKRSASDDHLSAAPSRHSVARVLAPRDKDQALQPLEEEDPRGSGSPSSSNEGATVRLGADEDEPSMRLPDEVPSAAFKGTSRVVGFRNGGSAAQLVETAEKVDNAGARLAAKGRGAQGEAGALTMSARAEELAAQERAKELVRAQADAQSLVEQTRESERRRLGGLQLGPIRIPLPTLPGRAGDNIRSRLGSIADEGRRMAIVTTAALPWMTGTSVNPLLRAAYLGREGKRDVTLVVPWLAKTDQQQLFPHRMTFERPEDQERYIREWVDKRVGFKTDFKIRFYPGRYAAEKCSILGVGDITACVPDEEADIAILEEPEHLNWYHHGRRWTSKFKHVVGVCHTNYLDYARREENGRAKAMILSAINKWVCRSHCHKVIKLSGAVQRMPREVTEFVHGVSPAFLEVGDRKARQAASAASPSAPSPADVGTTPGGDPAPSVFSRGAYFIGKAVWAKGYTELLERLAEHKARTGQSVHMDVYGSGEDLEDIKAEGHRRGLELTYWGAKDHLDKAIHDYKVFVNPSTSDVVATTTAEALAMGKIVVVQDLPCNQFFSTFENCLVYRTPEEFSEKIQLALSLEPKPMTAEERYRLTWEAATERFLRVAEIDGFGRSNPLERSVDWALQKAHNGLNGVEPLRRALGAGASTLRAPHDLASWEPVPYTGGVFDATHRAKKWHANGNGNGSVVGAQVASDRALS